MGTPLKAWQIVALLLVVLVCAGTLNRVVRTSRAHSALLVTPLASPLAQLVMEIGPYTGRDVPLEGDILRAAKVDSYVHREYYDATTGKRLVLYVGYWGRENVGMGHGPEVCYPSAGWSVDSAVRESDLRFRTRQAEVSAKLALHRFVRTETLGVQRCAVGFLATARGEFFPSSRGKFWHLPGRSGPDDGHYLAQIHVSTNPDSNGWERSEADIQEFFRLLMPPLADCLPRSEREGE